MVAASGRVSPLGQGPLRGPVIKQPRGGQIESVEETRERRRRGDGQLAATMVPVLYSAGGSTIYEEGSRGRGIRYIRK